MSMLVHETFDDGWEKSWSGQIKNAYKSGDSLRLMFRKGDHYGCALHKEVPPCRHVKVSYMVRALSNWDSDSTGKTLGFADLRYKDDKGHALGHGNRAPDPDGMSFRTWFGKTKDGYLPIGMYFYHKGQTPRWGDSVQVGQIKVGGPAVLFECEADFDEGFIRARVDGGDWTSHPLEVTDKTAVTWAWLDAYYGGAAVSPKDMAWDISDYKLENLGEDPAPVLNPEVDWDAVARMIAEEEMKKTEVVSQTAANLARQLRELADKVDALDN